MKHQEGSSSKSLIAYISITVSNHKTKQNKANNNKKAKTKQKTKVWLFFCDGTISNAQKLIRAKA